MEKVAPPFLMHPTLVASSFCDPPSSMTSKKRDLSYDLFHQNPKDNWNPNEWSWDSVSFVGKPLTHQNNVVVTNNSNNNNSNINEVEEETIELNLGGGGCGNETTNPIVSRPNKRVRSGSPSGAAASYPMCQVDNCREDLSNAKDYHRRHKVCELHSKASKALLANQLQRFCQQCSR